jgi:hypothetical protein
VDLGTIRRPPQVGDRPSQRPDGQTLYEFRVQCGLEILGLHFFTAAEVRQVASLLAEHGPGRAAAVERR